MFESGNVVKFKSGTEVMFFSGDTVELEYFLVASDQSDVPENSTKVYIHPYTLTVSNEELELVAEDEFSEFPNEFADGWNWWDSLEDTDEYTGPNWIEFLGR